MKKLSVTRSSHPATFRQCKNLGQLVAVIEKQGEKEGLFVTKVYLNGKAMDEEEENLLESLSTNEVKSLEVDLATLVEIVKNSIADIIASIQTTQMKAIQFAKEFRENKSADDEKVKYLLIQCRSVIESLEQVFAAHKKKSFSIKHLSLWHESEKELTNIIQCVLQSRRLSDHDFIADLIEYDLVQALDQWEETLEKELLDNSMLTGAYSTVSALSKTELDI